MNLKESASQSCKHGVFFLKHSLPLDTGWFWVSPNLVSLTFVLISSLFCLYKTKSCPIKALSASASCLWNTVDLETDAGERFTEAEVLVRSCVTKSCRKMTSAVQLAAGSKKTTERNENKLCVSGLVFLFRWVCSAICINTFSSYSIYLQFYTI